MNTPSNPFRPGVLERPPVLWYRTTIVVAVCGNGYLLLSGAFREAFSYLSRVSGPPNVPGRIALTAVLWAAFLAPFVITAARVGKSGEPDIDLHGAIITGAAAILRASLRRSTSRPDVLPPGNDA